MIRQASFGDYYRPREQGNPVTDALGLGVQLYGLQKKFDMQGKELGLQERQVALQEAKLPLEQQLAGIDQQNADTARMGTAAQAQANIAAHSQNFTPTKTAVLRAQFANMGLDKPLASVLDSIDALGKDPKVRNIDAYETIKTHWRSWYQPKMVEGLQKAIQDGMSKDPNYMNTTAGEAAQKMLDGISADSAGQMVDGLFTESIRSMEAEDMALMAKMRPQKDATPSPIGKLIAERNSLPAGSPERAVYDDAIKKETTMRGGTRLQTNPDGSIIFEEGIGIGGAGPAKLSKAVETKVQEGTIEMNSLLADVVSIRKSFDPSVFQIQDKAGAAWATLKDKLGAATPQDKAAIEKFVNAKADAARLFAERMRAMSGVAVTPQEAKRQEAYLPTPGNGVFDGDSPKEFDSKLTKMEQFVKRAVARYNYIRNNGLTKIDAVPLEKMDTVISQRGKELESQGLEKQAVLKTLAEEFGLMF